MPLCPFATWRPVTAHGPAMSSHLGVVFHVTAGEGDPYNEFANPANKVSSHFGIGNGQGGMADGLIEQYVDTANQSWAQVGGNVSYVSVETEGQPADALTAKQVTAFARLYQWIAQTHSVPYVITDLPGRPGLITHGDGGAAWGDHVGCPGSKRAAQRVQILDLADPPVPLPPPPVPWSPLEVEMKVFRNVTTGACYLVGGSATPAYIADAATLGDLTATLGAYTNVAASLLTELGVPAAALASHIEPTETA